MPEGTSHYGPSPQTVAGDGLLVASAIPKIKTAKGWTITIYQRQNHLN